MNLLSNKMFWIVLLVIVVVILIIWYFYNKGKSTPTIVNPPVDTSGSTNPHNNPVGLSNSTIKLFVDAAFADYDSYIKGALGLHNEDLYAPIAQMSDTDFVKAYDIWNNEYQAKDGRTMVQAIESMYGHWSGGGILNVQNVISEKASRLNLP